MKHWRIWVLALLTAVAWEWAYTRLERTYWPPWPLARHQEGVPAP